MKYELRSVYMIRAPKDFVVLRALQGDGCFLLFMFFEKKRAAVSREQVRASDARMVREWQDVSTAPTGPSGLQSGCDTG